MSDTPESWLSGPVEGVNAYLMPVAHALVQARRDLGQVTANLTVEELWDRPGGAASIGFQLQHVAGVLDRLCTYARGEELGTEQMRTLRSEGQRGEPPADTAASSDRPVRPSTHASTRFAPQIPHRCSSRAWSGASVSRAPCSDSSTTPPSTRRGTRARS